MQGVVRNIYYINDASHRILFGIYEMDGRLTREVLEWSTGEFPSAPGSNTFFLAWNNVSPSGDRCIPTSASCAY